MAKISLCINAIRLGNASLLKSYLDEGVDPCSEIYNWPLLLHAIREDQPELVKVLLSAGADWRGKDGYNRNSLEVACLKVCSPETIVILQEYGARFTHEAFKAASEGNVEYLTGKSEADIRGLLQLRDSGGYNIVHYAAVQMHTAFIDALRITPEDAKVESDNDLHENPLLLVAYVGSIRVVDYFVERYGMDPNAPRGSLDGTTPLLYAAYKGNVAMFDHFVQKYHSDPKAHRDDYGQSALLNAAYMGRVELFDHLVERYGVEYATDRNQRGKSALLLTVLDGHLGMFRHLVEKYNFDPLVERDNNGYSALLLSAWYGHTDFIDYLVWQCNCDLHEDRDIGKRNAIINAIRNCKVDMVRHLIAVHGVDPRKEVDSEGANLVINAARSGSTEILDYLMSFRVESTDIQSMQPQAESMEDPVPDGKVGMLPRAPSASSSAAVSSWTMSVSGSSSSGCASSSSSSSSSSIESPESLDSGVDRVTPPVAPSLGTFGSSSSSSSRGEMEAALSSGARAAAEANRGSGTGTGTGSDESAPFSSPYFDVRSDRDQDHYSCMLTAIWYGKTAMIDHLVSKYGVEIVGDKDKNGHGPMILATLGKQQGVIDHLISRYGMDINEKDASGNTPLMIAAARGYVKMLDVLIVNYKCNPRTERNSHCISCLLYAVMFQHIPMVDHLIGKHGCDPAEEFTIDNENMLHFAADDGNVDLMRHLLEQYSCSAELLRLRTKADGESPFLRAVRFGRIDMVDYLVGRWHCSLDADKDKAGNSALLVACKYGQKPMIDHLMRAHRCNIATSKNSAGQNAMALARARHQYATEQHLKAHYGWIERQSSSINPRLLEYWHRTGALQPKSADQKPDENTSSDEPSQLSNRNMDKEGSDARSANAQAAAAHTVDGNVDTAAGRELDLHLDGEPIEACIICYEVCDVASSSSAHLPILRCGTCKNSYHCSCFYTWTKKSGKHKDICVMCQQPML